MRVFCDLNQLTHTPRKTTHPAEDAVVSTATGRMRMSDNGIFGPGCRFRYQGRDLVVRAVTTSMVVAVPSHLRGEPDHAKDCICIARSELQQADAAVRQR